MLKIKFQTLSALLICTLLSACSDANSASPSQTSSLNNDSAPNRLPSAASLELNTLDNDNFQTQMVKGKYALQAVLTGAAVKLITGALLAGPVLVVKKAAEQKSDCQNALGIWTCNWSKVTLTPELKANVIGLKSPLTAPNFSFIFDGSFQGAQVTHYEGLTCNGCTDTSGTWTAHDLKAKQPALTLKYQLTGDRNRLLKPEQGESADLTLTLTKQIGSLPSGSSARYQAVGNQRDLTVINGKTSESRVISWDELKKSGKIISKKSATAQAEIGCWDQTGADVACP